MPDQPTITDVRRALIDQAADFNERRETHQAAMHHADGTDAHCDAYEGLARAGAYGLLLAGVLGQLERHPGTRMIAAALADVVADVIANGDEGIAEANDDLNQPATVPGGAR